MLKQQTNARPESASGEAAMAILYALKGNHNNLMHHKTLQLETQQADAMLFNTDASANSCSKLCQGQCFPC